MVTTLPPPGADPSSDVLDFCCGGRRKCPVLTKEPEAIVIADADQATGQIRLTREQVETAMPWLAEWLSR